MICLWCGRELQLSKYNHYKKYCSNSHRQMYFYSKNYMYRRSQSLSTRRRAAGGRDNIKLNKDLAFIVAAMMLEKEDLRSA